MRRDRRPNALTPILLGAALVAVIPREAPAGVLRLVDGDGVVHLTDVPQIRGTGPCVDRPAPPPGG
jgi:hypothetical protein